MDKEFEEWLENDWFTSGETSWEEYSQVVVSFPTDEEEEEEA